MKAFFYLFGIMVVVSLAGCQPTAKDGESAAPVDQVGSSSGQTMPSAAETTAAIDALPADAGLAPEVLSSAETAEVDSEFSSDMELSTSAIFEKPTSEEIQTALKNAGFYQGSVDGKIGPKSKQAIKDFQSQNQLVVDGKIGPKTWAKLQSYLNASSTATAAGVSN